MYGQSIKKVLIGQDMSIALPPGFDFAVVSLPGRSVKGLSNMQFTIDHLQKGVALVGATGSGKTYCGKQMANELRKNLQNYSMVVIQAKNDFNEIMRDGDLILEQGAKSKRNVRWNLFNDILNDGYDIKMIELNTREFVKHLFVYKKDSREHFFVEGASELLYCIIVAYIKNGLTNLHERCKWSNKGLRDFFLKYDKNSYLQVIENCGEPGVLNRILGEDTDNKQALGVWGELVTTVLQTFIDVFAEEGDFSIRKFVKEKKNHTLFINYDPAYKDTQVRIYSSIINLLLKETLAQNGSFGNVILLCDELPIMGKTDIANAVNLGRAKGLLTICGIQSIEQVKAIYGEHEGLAMLAGLCNKIYFKPNDPTTKRYMQEDFGKTLVEHMVLSPGGSCSERRDGYGVEDEDINIMGIGDCFVKTSDGDMYKFHMV